jgi:hypothetical protein
LLFLGLALSVAEEFLIQQTSVAPMVIRLRGETWARAFDLNYVYFIWALAYESVWVVLLSTLATELMFPERRHETWLSRAGAIVTGILFLVGCFFAWFSWTQIARTKVFHQPPFTPPLHLILLAIVAFVLLVAAAVRSPERFTARALTPPPRGCWEYWAQFGRSSGSAWPFLPSASRPMCRQARSSWLLCWSLCSC